MTEDRTLTIREIRARAVDAPVPRPVRTAVVTIPSAQLVLIDVLTRQGIVGRAYIFAYTRAALVPLVRMIQELDHELRDAGVVPVQRMRDLDRRFRLLGCQGLVGMAVSGLDMAFWDALGQAACWPVARLLGGCPVPLPAYDSYGMIDPAADEGDLRRSVESGFRGIKIKLGGGDLRQDLATVRAVRGIVGPDIALMVDYNQSLDPPEARRRIARIAEYDIHWVEEPVPAEDLAGHAQVRAGSPVQVQTGENWWFPRGIAQALAAGASDLGMIDLGKIGGVTGWMRAAAQAEAASLPLSSHIFTEASAHVLAVTPTAHWLEHLDLAGAVLEDPCTPVGGMVTAKGPGLGIAWNEAAVERYKVG